MKNKKEIFYKFKNITDKSTNVFEMHEKMNKELLKHFKQCTDEELILELAFWYHPDFPDAPPIKMIKKLLHERSVFKI